MKAKPTRVVLAIFSAKEEEPEKAFQALRGLRGAAVTLLRPEGNVEGVPEGAEKYSALRLEGESFLVVKGPPSAAPAAIKHLRAAGAPAVFVQREGLGSTAEAERSHWESAAGQAPVLKRLKENQALLEAARSDLLEAAHLGHTLTAAAEWILDNGYLIRTQVAEVRRFLPRNYPKGLPAQNAAPRIYHLAQELAVGSDF